jgi:hypothetical protein
MEERVYERIRRFMPRTARWAYWQDGRGPMFVYNTERLMLADESDPANGRFESCVFVPYGPGSRSGKGSRWQELEGSRSAHDLRRDAKGRAYRLYLAWQETGKVVL